MSLLASNVYQGSPPHEINETGFLKPPPRIFWWLVASHIFQPPEKKDLQSDTLVAGWLGGWVAGGWMLVAGGWAARWLVAGG